MLMHTIAGYSYYAIMPWIVTVLSQAKTTVVRDPDDNKILERAAETETHVVAAFGKDLLDLKE